MVEQSPETRRFALLAVPNPGSRLPQYESPQLCMLLDPHNHTRWNHKPGLHNRLNWAGDEDWTGKRDMRTNKIDRIDFVTFALRNVRLGRTQTKNLGKT